MLASRTVRRCVLAGALLLGALGASGCVPVPLRITPGVEGRVVDARTGAPVAGALIAVRYDARHGDLLPERDLVGHREVTTDATGRFRVPGGARAGLTAWPHARTEVRVVGVIREGYRCARPVRAEGVVTVRLEPAEGLDDRRASCRPLASKPDETPAYHAAWRDLYPRESSDAERQLQRELGRVLDARAAFGFGENCSGPAVDLALSSDGERAAVTVEEGGGRRVEIVDLSAGARSLGRIEDAPGAGRRLAWNDAGELVLWEPASALDRRASSPVAPGGAPDTLWRPEAPPASQAQGHGRPHSRPDLDDEAEARWMGRSFRLVRRLHPHTGLGRDLLRVTSADGEDHVVPLPGETCGPPGQYGRPHFRIDASGRRGLDLRFVEGGCRAVAIDLRDGSWSRLDSSHEAGRCARVRRVPLELFRRALRGYAEEVESALLAAEGDPDTEFALRLGDGPAVRVHAQNYMGEPLELVLGPLPLRTPLRRIEVTSVAGAGVSVPGGRPAIRTTPDRPRLEPL